MGNKFFQNKSRLKLVGALVLLMLVAAIFYWQQTFFVASQQEATAIGAKRSLYEEATKAIKMHDHRRLQVLLEKDPSLVNVVTLAKDGNPDSLLSSAIYWEDEISVGILLQEGANPNGKDELIPLEEAINKLNIIPLDAPNEIGSLRLHVPAELELIRQYIKQKQLTRSRIILLLLNSGANFSGTSNAAEKKAPNLFESLTLSLCDSTYYEPEVLNLFRKSAIEFKPETDSETVFRQHILVNAVNGVLDPDCVLFMYGR